ncbi:hypothetical protein I79_020444 [Cricetulus griseus]|uniref:Uncharacterized protein n=1 Tax=Cricetulus griseus TaxID=10029 RepID=G3IA28_CRIGR|nr:hypothetical protein I79_020444 [Cricetulus griseus]
MEPRVLGTIHCESACTLPVSYNSSHLLLQDRVPLSLNGFDLAILLPMLPECTTKFS